VLSLPLSLPAGLPAGLAGARRAVGVGREAERYASSSKIAENVLLARTAGVSWIQVGRAANLSKRGAHQRWGQH